MFQWLGKFKKIFVTGPQRSGTRICAKMIAYDTGYEYIDEQNYHMDSLYYLFSILEESKKCVVHCPVLCRYIHIFSSEDTAIILMRRKISDIIDSQKRIGWQWEWLELARYDCSEGNIAEIKYQFWDSNQRKKIKNAFEIDFESLADHPLWVPKKSRQKFKAEQTTMRLVIPTQILSFYPFPNLGIFYHEHPNDNMALLVKTNQPVKELNAIGCIIWSLCDGKHSNYDILQKLKEHFNNIEENILKRDLFNFISDLVACGFLRYSSKALQG